MKKKSFLVVALLMTGSLIVGCSALQGGNNEQPAIALVDGLGRRVTLDQPAQRVVSLSPSTTEILYAIGAGDQVVGRDNFSNYPVEALEVQDVGGSMGVYSFEIIASLEPDLVLAAGINTPEQVKAIEDLGITVFFLANPEDMDALYAMIATVGTLTGNVEKALTLTTSLRKRVEAVMQIVGGAASQPVVFYELDGSDPAKPWTPGPGSFLEYLINLAGGVNAGSVMQSEWAQLSVEEILVRDPHLIILGDSIYGTTPAQVALRPGWQQLTAVKENRVYPFNDDLVSRPGPRMVDGLEELIRLIHPELY